jgi:hypothetical protein
MKIRLTEAVSGRLDGVDGLDELAVPIDPGEYSALVHHSGHYKLELPNNQYAFLTHDDFENGVKSGFILINS